MAFTVDPITHVISVPKADLALVGGTLYNHDTEAFRLALRGWEDSEEGIVQPKTHNHNTQQVIVGTTYARGINMLAPYSIEYEDGQYSIVLQGSNNNMWDVESGILVQNQVQVIPTNAAGLIVNQASSTISEQDKLDIANRVWIYSTRSITTFGSLIADLWAYVTRTLTTSASPTVEEIRTEMDDNSTELAAIKERTENLPDDPADVSDIPTVVEIATAVWAFGTRSLTTFGSLVSDIWNYIVRTLTSTGTPPPTVEEIRTEMDDNSTEFAAIKERTDNLPDNPADVSDVPTAEENALELLDNQDAP